MENGTMSLLEKINSPADLRRLPVDQLPQVCSELRSFLINSLSSHPGHFASSMGAVELTVALHYVFNTPYDRIVWDVGHQAYGHKILTGRRDKFDTNRTLGGLSGFPNPKANMTHSLQGMPPTPSRRLSAWPWPPRCARMNHPAMWWLS